MKSLTAFTLSLLMVLTFYSVSGCKQHPEPERAQASSGMTSEEPRESQGDVLPAGGDDVLLLERINRSLASVADTVKPSVVNISTTTTISMKESPFGDFFNDPFFRKFFGDQFDPHGRQRKYKTSALGSGVIVTADGYILTNNHVVENVDEIKVILQDKREFTGKRIGTDPQTDLAIVKVQAEGLPAVRFGDSEKLKVGELVIAVGNPFGLGNTITMGIVSAVGRSHVGIADYEDFIQTDAAINPGNSGGALVNIHGELVGINTAIFSTSGGNVGIGFAVPSAMAQSVMGSIIKHGKVVRGWLGVSIQEVTPELSRHFDIKETKGALVADVVKDSPAEKAGVKRGDLIVGFEGESVESPTALRNMVAGRQPGSRAEVKLIRNGKEMTLSVTLGELPKTAEAGETGEYDNALAGVYVQELTPAIRESLNIAENVTGVIVTRVDGDSPAAAGLRQNDVIQEINRKAVRSMKDYNEAVSGIKEQDNVLLLVYRGGGYLYVTISP
ncbi:MAG: DegQ family serine endoprotease [Nitrospiraceae bacterium]|nr:MAG: DegQ family serine endoprotease [Nitrospiraceae bacterium]